MNTKVSIVRCPDYSQAKDAIIESLELIGGLEKIIKPGDRVLLKANILAARLPEDAVTTHPAIITAMCELVSDIGGIPIVGDGSGITHSGATAEALKISGIEDAAQKCGAEIVNFETAGFVEVDVPDAKQFPRLYIAKPILEADVIISLPKLKTHELTYYTGAVKNFFGAVPLKTRKQAHLLAKRDLFGDAVVDIYSIVKPHLAVMDGIVGMEGNGPAHGMPINSGIVMASYDCVALDMVASELIGFDPMIIPTNRAALKRNVGTGQPEVVGTLLDDVKVKFKESAGGITTMAPAFITRRLGNLFTMRPCIDTAKCILCGACVLNCSPHAIEEVDERLKINNDKCIQCYCCRELCPQNAVDIKKSLVAKILTRGK
ncbi:MAG: DUF362 domain-containing protein [Methanosarcinaceae archaeon]|nr:DUF362 domain-containing protein [Methanosarcinaceae archaeon]MDF1534099.1 DUF362 domain-containing protein [Methanosarcinaceae archaeon]